MKVRPVILLFLLAAVVCSRKGDLVIPKNL